MASLKQSPPFYTKLAMVLISLIALFYIAILGKPILAPLLFGLLFRRHAAARRWLPGEKTPVSPKPGLPVLGATAGAFAGSASYLVGSQVTNLADDWPQFKQQVLSSVNDLQRWISLKFHIRIKQQNTYVSNTATSKLLETGGSVLGDVVVSLAS